MFKKPFKNLQTDRPLSPSELGFVVKSSSSGGSAPKNQKIVGGGSTSFGSPLAARRNIGVRPEPGIPLSDTAEKRAAFLRFSQAPQEVVPVSAPQVQVTISSQHRGVERQTASSTGVGGRNDVIDSGHSDVRRPFSNYKAGSLLGDKSHYTMEASDLDAFDDLTSDKSVNGAASVADEQEDESAVDAWSAGASEIVHQQMMGALSKALVGADDVLFGWASRCKNDKEYRACMDLMRLLRLKKDNLLTEFQKYLLDATMIGASEGAISEFSVETLSIQDDDQLERKLALKNFVHKMDEVSKNDWDSVLRRFEWLAKSRDLQVSLACCTPQHIANSLEKVVNSLQVELEPELILLKLCENALVAQAVHAYKEVDKWLLANGVGQVSVSSRQPQMVIAAPRVMPVISTTSPRQRSQDLSPSARDALMPGYGRHEYAGVRYSAPQEEAENELGFAPAFMDELHAPEGQGAAWAQQTPGASVALDGMLRALRDQISSSQGAATWSAMREDPYGLGGVNFTDHQLAQDLSTKLSSAPHSALTQRAQMLGQLFDTYTQDNSLTQPARDALQKLRYPIFKASLADETFFTNEKHPLRNLLNYVSQYSSAEKDPARLNSMIERVSQEAFANQNWSPSQIRQIATKAKHFSDQGYREFVGQIETGKKVRRQQAIVSARKVVEPVLSEHLNKYNLHDETAVAFLRQELMPLATIAFLNFGEESEQYNRACYLHEEIASALATHDLSPEKAVQVEEAVSTALFWSNYPKERRERAIKSLKALLKLSTAQAQTEVVEARKADSEQDGAAQASIALSQPFDKTKGWQDASAKIQERASANIAESSLDTTPVQQNAVVAAKEPAELIVTGESVVVAESTQPNFALEKTIAIVEGVAKESIVEEVQPVLGDVDGAATKTSAPSIDEALNTVGEIMESGHVDALIVEKLGTTAYDNELQPIMESGSSEVQTRGLERPESVSDALAVVDMTANAVIEVPLLTATTAIGDENVLSVTGFASNTKNDVLMGLINRHVESGFAANNTDVTKTTVEMDVVERRGRQVVIAPLNTQEIGTSEPQLRTGFVRRISAIFGLGSKLDKEDVGHDQRSTNAINFADGEYRVQEASGLSLDIESFDDLAAINITVPVMKNSPAMAMLNNLPDASVRATVIPVRAKLTTEGSNDSRLAAFTEKVLSVLAPNKIAGVDARSVAVGSDFSMSMVKQVMLEEAIGASVRGVGGNLVKPIALSNPDDVAKSNWVAHAELRHPALSKSMFPLPSAPPQELEISAADKSVMLAEKALLLVQKADDVKDKLRQVNQSPIRETLASVDRPGEQLVSKVIVVPAQSLADTPTGEGADGGRELPYKMRSASASKAVLLHTAWEDRQWMLSTPVREAPNLPWMKKVVDDKPLDFSRLTVGAMCAVQVQNKNVWLRLQENNLDKKLLVFVDVHGAKKASLDWERFEAMRQSGQAVLSRSWVGQLQQAG